MIEGGIWLKTRSLLQLSFLSPKQVFIGKTIQMATVVALHG